MTERIGDRAVNEARRWVGTPYRHRASVCGSGADCLGLVRGIWRALYVDEPELMPAYSPDWSEASGDEKLWQALDRNAVSKSVADAMPGDLILFRMRENGVAKHVGVQTEVSEVPRFVHAYHGHGVVENTLSVPWARRAVARFEFPERRG